MTNLDSVLKSKDSTLPTKWYSQNYGLSSSHVQLWELDHKEGECWRTDAFKPWCWRGLLWVPWTVRRSNQSILKERKLKYSLEGLMLSWSSNTMATWGEEPTQWKRPWCCESLRAGEEDDRGWDGCMVSLMQWTWTWANYGRWWGTGKPGMLQSMGSQSVGHDLATEQQRYILFILTIIELMDEFSTKIWKPKRPEKIKRKFFESQDCPVDVIKWLNAQNLK